MSMKQRIEGNESERREKNHKKLMMHCKLSSQLKDYSVTPQKHLNWKERGKEEEREVREERTRKIKRMQSEPSFVFCVS